MLHWTTTFFNSTQLKGSWISISLNVGQALKGWAKLAFSSEGGCIHHGPSYCVSSEEETGGKGRGREIHRGREREDTEGERERHRGRERGRDTEGERGRDTEGERERERHRGRHRGRERGRERGRDTEGERTWLIKGRKLALCGSWAKSKFLWVRMS